jgi:carbohydrate-binding DOMON domain-containing protein
MKAKVRSYCFTILCVSVLSQTRTLAYKPLVPKGRLPKLSGTHQTRTHARTHTHTRAHTHTHTHTRTRTHTTHAQVVYSYEDLLSSVLPTWENLISAGESD